ncbi:MAG: hypothetical protein HY609_06070 [Deltaproteobacteria bacterium]|nr:hypothetical protein [Deltaproteobacteria bacterium]
MDQGMAGKKSKLPVNPTQKDYLHYNAVLLEEIRSQMGAVIETVEVNNTQLNEKIDGVEKRLTDRIETVEAVVQSHSGQLTNIQKKLEEHDQRFEKIDQRFDRLENKVEIVETDVKEIKQKLNDVADKVERYDEDIALLKSAVTQT